MPYFVSAVVACGIVVDFTEAGGATSTFVASITGSEPQNLLNRYELLANLCLAKYVAGGWDMVQ